MGDTNGASSTRSTDLRRVEAERKGVRAAFDRLERAAARPATDRIELWCGNFRAQLADVRTAFQYHVEVTEARDGLFADIIAKAPRLAPRAEELRRDHRIIEAAISRATAAIDAEEAPTLRTVAGARDATVDLISRISRHRHLGAEIVYDAFNVDIEAAD